MMVEIKKILDLHLDSQNPRFFDGKKIRSEPEIIKYLLEYEEIIPLANEINDYGGLLLGERLICTIENGNYVVLEGNRRCTACKLLLDPKLIPPEFKSKFPHINEETRNMIEEIEIDIIDSRDEAAYVLSKRHVDGPRKWGAFEKKRFHVFHYERTKSLKLVGSLSSFSEQTIREDCKDYYFYQTVKDIFIKNHSDSFIPEDDKPTFIWDRLYRFLKPYLEFAFDANYNLVIPDDEEQKSKFLDILSDFGHLYWEEKVLNSRTANTEIDFRKKLSVYPNIEKKLYAYHNKYILRKIDEIHKDSDSNSSSGTTKKENESGMQKKMSNSNSINPNAMNTFGTTAKPSISNPNTKTSRGDMYGNSTHRNTFLPKGFNINLSPEANSLTIELSSLKVTEFKVLSATMIRPYFEACINGFLGNKDGKLPYKINKIISILTCDDFGMTPQEYSTFKDLITKGEKALITYEGSSNYKTGPLLTELNMSTHNGVFDFEIHRSNLDGIILKIILAMNKNKNF